MDRIEQKQIGTHFKCPDSLRHGFVIRLQDVDLIDPALIGTPGAAGYRQLQDLII